MYDEMLDRLRLLENWCGDLENRIDELEEASGLDNWDVGEAEDAEDVFRELDEEWDRENDDDDDDDEEGPIWGPRAILEEEGDDEDS